MAENKRIQGKSIGSKNELNVAMALDKLEIEYEYQYVIGLPGARGSQVIDFLVITRPKPTPLFVHGEYWHTGVMAANREDELKMTELYSMTRKQWYEPMIIWGEDCETFDDAFNWLKKELIL